MRVFLCVCISSAAAVALQASIKVGDTFQKVLREMGRPSGSIEAGTALSLHYPEQVIKLERGKVVAIEAPPARAADVPVQVAAVSAAPTPAAPAQPATPAVARPVHGGVHPGRWTTEYAAALAAAKEQGRRVLVYFSGSDSSSGCMQLRHEIFSTPEFGRYASEKLVLVEVDFPKRRKLPPALKAQNEELKRQYGIHVFPIVVVLDSSGQQLGMLGYVEGGPKAFIAALESL